MSCGNCGPGMTCQRCAPRPSQVTPTWKYCPRDGKKCAKEGACVNDRCKAMDGAIAPSSTATPKIYSCEVCKATCIEQNEELEGQKTEETLKEPA